MHLNWKSLKMKSAAAVPEIHEIHEIIRTKWRLG